MLAWQTDVEAERTRPQPLVNKRVKCWPRWGLGNKGAEGSGEEGRQIKTARVRSRPWKQYRTISLTALW